MELKDLPVEERLQLMRFVCSFAWADLQVEDREKNAIRELVLKLSLTEDESREVEGWLKIPPRPEDVDPFEIPHERRQIFLNTVLDIVRADGVIDSNEIENFSLLEQLLR